MGAQQPTIFGNSIGSSDRTNGITRPRYANSCQTHSLSILIGNVSELFTWLVEMAVFELDDSVPPVGAEIVALGYEGMAVENEVRDGAGREGFRFGRQLLLRGGCVTSVHPNGLRLCKGPCVETSIPVFPGMSGGPVMRAGCDTEAMRPFGLISSNPYDEQSTKWDRSVRGSSIVPLIGATVKLNSAGQRETMLRLDAGFWTLNRAELERAVAETPQDSRE